MRLILGSLVGLVGGTGAGIGRILSGLVEAGFGAVASFVSIAVSAAAYRQLAVRKKRWVVYAKPPFAGPEAVLAYLSRYTHRVAISNSRLLRFDGAGVTFRYKIPCGGWIATCAVAD